MKSDLINIIGGIKAMDLYFAGLVGIILGMCFSIIIIVVYDQIQYESIRKFYKNMEGERRDDIYSELEDLMNNYALLYKSTGKPTFAHRQKGVLRLMVELNAPYEG